MIFNKELYCFLEAKSLRSAAMNTRFKFSMQFLAIVKEPGILSRNMVGYFDHLIPDLIAVCAKKSSKMF